jgi:hypothetical protein
MHFEKIKSTWTLLSSDCMILLEGAAACWNACHMISEMKKELNSMVTYFHIPKARTPNIFMLQLYNSLSLKGKLLGV